jgi:mycoredoxin
VTDPKSVVVFWRPGCGFCSSLLRGLDRQGLDYDRVNIWEDPDGAAFVRSVARGNETVPTVRVGDVALVNPTSTDVLRAVADQAPVLLPDDWEPPQAGRAERMLHRLLGGGGSQ